MSKLVGLAGQGGATSHSLAVAGSSGTNQVIPNDCAIHARKVKLVLWPVTAIREMKVRESSLKLLLHIFTFTILVFMAGCGSIKHLPDVPDLQRWQLWLDQQERVGAFSNWSFSGRLGLRVPKKSGSMSVEWLQNNQQYTLYLDGPFGVSLAHIEGNERQVSAILSDGEKVVGRTPEYLMYQLTGWELPVSSLKYWIRGLPAPGGEARVSLNNAGIPEKISQQGWDITYLRFDEASGVSVPSHIRAVSGDIQITLVVSNWQLR